MQVIFGDKQFEWFLVILFHRLKSDDGQTTIDHILVIILKIFGNNYIRYIYVYKIRIIESVFFFNLFKKIHKKVNWIYFKTKFTQLLILKYNENLILNAIAIET